MLKVQTPNGEDKVLLHSCCAPCSSAIIECMLENGIRPTVFYCNPNIYPQAEYEIRKEEAIRFVTSKNLDFIDADYDYAHWLHTIKGLENEPRNHRQDAACQSDNQAEDAQDDEKNVHRCIVSVGEDDSGCSLLLESVVYDNGAGAACAHRREPYIVGCEAALLDGFGAVFQSSEVGIDIVCTECEFDSTCFGATDNLETGNPRSRFCSGGFGVAVTVLFCDMHCAAGSDCFQRSHARCGYGWCLHVGTEQAGPGQVYRLAGSLLQYSEDCGVRALFIRIGSSSILC